MDAVHECGVIAHLGWHRAQKVSDLLLLLDVDIEIADHDDAAFGPDILLATAELARGHIAFHDVDAVLLVEAGPCYFVKVYDVVLTHQTALPVRVVQNIFATVALPPEIRCA